MNRQCNFHLSPGRHNYQSCLFTEWILMLAPLWRWSMASSLTVEHQSLWLTGRSYAALISFHFEIYGFGSLWSWGGPHSTPCLFLKCFFFFLNTHWLVDNLFIIWKQEAHPETCSVLNVLGAEIGCLQAHRDFMWANCSFKCGIRNAYVCMKSHSEGGVCVKSSTQHTRRRFS